MRKRSSSMYPHSTWSIIGEMYLTPEKYRQMHANRLWSIRAHHNGDQFSLIRNRAVIKIKNPDRLTHSRNQV